MAAPDVSDRRETPNLPNAESTAITVLLGSGGAAFVIFALRGLGMY